MAVERAEQKHYEKALAYAEELKDLVRRRFPEARFSAPVYWEDEGVWVMDAYTSAEDDFQVIDLVGDRELEILLRDGLHLCLIPMPLSAYKESR